jgi:hypothetical protein
MTQSLKLGFFGPMKTLDSASWALEAIGAGGLRAWIDHAPMPGVTPAIMRWWFEHVDSFTTFNGTDFTGPEVRAYRYWHPFDHIKVSWAKKVLGSDGRIGEGSVIAIDEDIGGRYPVRAKARVSRFDDGAFNFDLLAGGVAPVGQVLHVWDPSEGGLRFRTEVIIDSPVPIIGPILTWLARRFAFTDDLLNAWILHNIEESGETERFVPQLYEHANLD